MTSNLWNRRTAIYASNHPCPCTAECPDRQVEPNCHTNCERYIEWNKLRNAYRAEKDKADLLYKYEGEFAAKVHNDKMRKKIK